MNKPNKQEMEQLKSLSRQLNRLAYTTDSLYRRMAVNGRDRSYVDLARRASVELEQLASQVDMVMIDEY
ncbi:hypothetical protein P9847_18585 [Paenibacillus chibensis]|uniref:Spo0E family sporulation regulatory protein-aspartic acid phosphatase n=1 Tax=Paenibacillus chibensis TaxID=59846 RepID=A0ABU6PWP2_9BACL|nr:hypothetical protein [Paenibacillus chibensis]